MKKTLLKIKKIKNKIVRTIKIALVIWTTMIGFFTTIFTAFLVSGGGTLNEYQFVWTILLTFVCETCLVAWLADQYN